jgi:hypothetical protein
MLSPEAAGLSGGLFFMDARTFRESVHRAIRYQLGCYKLEYDSVFGHEGFAIFHDLRQSWSLNFFSEGLFVRASLRFSFSKNANGSSSFFIPYAARTRVSSCSCTVFIGLTPRRSSARYKSRSG